MHAVPAHTRHGQERVLCAAARQRLRQLRLVAAQPQRRTRPARRTVPLYLPPSSASGVRRSCGRRDKDLFVRGTRHRAARRQLPRRRVRPSAPSILFGSNGNGLDEEVVRMTLSMAPPCALPQRAPGRRTGTAIVSFLAPVQVPGACASRCLLRVINPSLPSGVPVRPCLARCDLLWQCCFYMHQVLDR